MGGWLGSWHQIRGQQKKNGPLKIYSLYVLVPDYVLHARGGRYVYEHSERHGYPGEWIGITFSITTFWNGILAIFAGQQSYLYALIKNLKKFS